MAERSMSVSQKTESDTGKKAARQQIGPSVGRPLDTPADRILFLQRAAGNRAVESLFRSGSIQAKLEVGRPGDMYEQEADRVADQVMRMPDTAIEQSSISVTPLIQREVGEDEDEVVQAQRACGGVPQVTSDMEASINSLKGCGSESLDAETRAFFESRFQRDFSGVRIHADANAAHSARSINAKAFTYGNNVVFGSGHYSPSTEQGKNLLAHELAHVVQQNGNNRALQRKPLEDESQLSQNEVEKPTPESIHPGYVWQEPDGTWVFSELPNPIKQPKIEMAVEFDKKNLAVGKARYTNAVHLNKYIAIHPGGLGNTGTPSFHANVEFHVKVDGKKVPMDVRRIRYWNINFAEGATVANNGKWEVDLKSGLYLWDRPGSEDAPGMMQIPRPEKPIGELHEFIAGNSKSGGIYYQLVTLRDPDGTARVTVYNLKELTPYDFKKATKFFSTFKHPNTLLFDDPLTENRVVSDSGVLRTIPEMAKKAKKHSEQKK